MSQGSEDYTHALAQWKHISMQSQSDIIKLGQAWLRSYGSLPIAGEVLARLLDIAPSARLKLRSETWLRNHSDQESAPALLALLLRTESSPFLLKLSTRFLEEAEAECFGNNEFLPLKPVGIVNLMKVILSRHTRANSVKVIEQYIEKYPDSLFWRWIFPISTYKTGNKCAERLTERWIRLNIKNPQLFLRAIPVLTPSANVVQASFKWIQQNQKWTDVSGVLIDVLLKSKSADILPTASRLSRNWLRVHEDHPDAGKMYGTLVLATTDVRDVHAALTWYKDHSENKTAKFVLSDLLELAFRSAVPPDLFVLAQAKTLLKDHPKRKEFPRLVGSAVSASPDPEIIEYAKETFREQRLYWVLIRLLIAAPDSESITMALDHWSDWVNKSIEPEMLCALLSADPSNKRVRRRAFYCAKKNPNDSYSRVLIKLLQSE